MKVLLIGIFLICLNGFTGSTFDTITKFLSINNYKWYHYYSLGGTVAILTLLIVALITFIFYQNKNNKTPEFTTLQKEITIKDDYITELKKDKQLLIDNSKNANDFKDISEKSFNEYKTFYFSSSILGITFLPFPPFCEFKI